MPPRLRCENSRSRSAVFMSDVLDYTPAAFASARQLRFLEAPALVPRHNYIKREKTVSPIDFKIRKTSLAVAALVLVLAACASKGPEVIKTNGLIPIKETKLPNVRAYRAADFDRSQYNAMLIEPATIYNGADADWGGASEEDRQRIAQKLTAEFKRVLGEQSRLVDQPGPGVVRIDLTLVGINQSHPVLSTALRLTPAGLVMTAARGVQSKGAPFTGSINVAGLASDSESNKVLAAVQAIVEPSAINLTSGLTPLRAAELSTTRAAEAFRDYLNRTKGSQ